MSSINLTQQGTGPALLLLHGWGFDHTIWSSLLPNLTPHYTVYCVDLPGFGQTRSMPWDAFKQALLEALSASFTLLGWSMGGLVATRLALERPERISRLINISSSPYFVAEENWPGIPLKNLNAFYHQLKTNPKETHQAFIQLQLGSKSLNITAPVTTPEGLKHGLDMLSAWDFREQLHDLKPPASYIFGRLDSIVPARTLKTLQARHPNFHYELIRTAAHAPFLSHPDAFMASLIQCLKEN